MFNVNSVTAKISVIKEENNDFAIKELLINHSCQAEKQMKETIRETDASLCKISYNYPDAE